MSGEIQVLLVDDHASFREPLAFMLEREPDLDVAAQAESLSEAREVLADEHANINLAIVDLDLPDGSGLDLIAELRRARPQAQALVLSATSDRLLLARTIEAGAAGVMHKSSRLEDIIDGVRRLHAGGQLLSQQEIIEALRTVVREREKDHDAQAAISSLTSREREVLQAIAEGLGDREISQRLYIGVGTVRTHVTSILSKLDAGSRLEALVFAVRHGAVRID